MLLKIMINHILEIESACPFLLFLAIRIVVVITRQFGKDVLTLESC